MKFKVGDKVKYQISKTSTVYYGVIVRVTRKDGFRTYAVKYTYEEDGKVSSWVDEHEPGKYLSILTPLEELL